MKQKIWEKMAFCMSWPMITLILQSKRKIRLSKKSCQKLLLRQLSKTIRRVIHGAMLLKNISTWDGMRVGRECVVNVVNTNWWSRASLISKVDKSKRILRAKLFSLYSIVDTVGDTCQLFNSYRNSYWKMWHSFTYLSFENSPNSENVVISFTKIKLHWYHNFLVRPNYSMAK